MGQGASEERIRKDLLRNTVTLQPTLRSSCQCLLSLLGVLYTC